MDAMKPVLLLISVVVALTASCNEHPAELPSPVGYDGFLTLGWKAIQEGDYNVAFDYFEQAIDIDVFQPDAYLGGGIACLYLEDHWDLADAFLQAAIQQDLGISAVVRHTDRTLLQDTLWTVFECIDEDLPQDSLNAWLTMTSDSGAVWVGKKVRDYLESEGLSTNLQFRFSPALSDIVACNDLYNGQSGAFYSVDSIVSDYIHLDVPMFIIKVGEVRYYTWIMVGQNIVFDYATLHAEATSGQITKDALAGWTMMQEIRGTDDGDLLQAAACSQGLLHVDPGYVFGEGDSLRESIYDLDIIDVVACGASFAFLREEYIYAWFMCREAGYGLDLDPESETFLLDLLDLLTEMRS